MTFGFLHTSSQPQHKVTQTLSGLFRIARTQYRIHHIIRFSVVFVVVGGVIELTDNLGEFMVMMIFGRNVIVIVAAALEVTP